MGGEQQKGKHYRAETRYAPTINISLSLTRFALHHYFSSSALDYVKCRQVIRTSFQAVLFSVLLTANVLYYNNLRLQAKTKYL